jgi:hypothetical protein
MTPPALEEARASPEAGAAPEAGITTTRSAALGGITTTAGLAAVATSDGGMRAGRT